MTISVCAVATKKQNQSLFDHKLSMTEADHSSAPMLPAVVSPVGSVVAPVVIPSETVTASDGHVVESSGNFAMSFADGLVLDIDGHDDSSSWSKEVSDDDDSDDDVSLVDSEDENSKNGSSRNNENDVNEDSTSSITTNNDELNEVGISQSVEALTKESGTKVSGDGCCEQTEDSSESFLEGDDAAFNVNESSANENENMDDDCAPAKIFKTRRGLQRKATGDSDTLGAILHGFASGRRDDEPLINRTVRRGRRNAPGDTSNGETLELNIEAVKKEPMKTRRGVQRIPTGDSDTLIDMIKQSSKSIPDNTPTPMETTRRGGRRKSKSDAKVEVIGIAEAITSKGPLKTRRGVQRKATGDSDTLIALVQGMDPVGTTSLETSKVRRGGRKKERTSDDIKESPDPLPESKGPLRTRKGLRRQATGDSDTLADLIAHKRNTAVEGME